MGVGRVWTHHQSLQLDSIYFMYSKSRIIRIQVDTAILSELGKDPNYVKSKLWKLVDWTEKLSKLYEPELSEVHCSSYAIPRSHAGLLLYRSVYH